MTRPDLVEPWNGKFSSRETKVVRNRHSALLASRDPVSKRVVVLYKLEFICPCLTVASLPG